MKRIYTLICLLAMSWTGFAQLDLDLPDIMQERIFYDQLDLTVDYDEAEKDKPVEQYYRFIERTVGSDTLLGYKWKPMIEEWELCARIIKDYDDGEVLQQKTFQHLRPDGWVNKLHYAYTYLDDGKIEEILIQRWDFDEADWVDHFKKTWTYNDAGHRAQVQTQRYFKVQEEWKNRHLKQFTWSGDTLIADTVKVFDFNFEDWKRHHFTAYHYNDSGNIAIKARFFWKAFWQVWEKTQQVHFFYGDSTGLLAHRIVKKNPTGDGWLNKSRYNYFYNDAGDVRAIELEQWKHNAEIWAPKRKVAYAYNDQGWMSVIVWKSWKWDAQDWVNEKRALMDYDADGNMTKRVLQVWKHQVEDWMNFRKWEMVLDYKMVMAVNDQSFENVNVLMSNPYQSGEQIAIEGLESGTCQLVLYSITGQVVDQKILQSNETTSFSGNLNPGLYIMVLSDENGSSYSKKIVVN